MSQPSTKTESGIGAQQQQLGGELAGMGANLFQQSQQEQAPLVTFLQGIAGGNKSDLTTAAAPILSQISGGAQKSKDTIMATMPPGAARDEALANLQVSNKSNVASTLNSTYTNALGALGNVSNTNAGLSLNAFGGGLSGLSGASQTQNNIMQADAASKASTMGFLGNLAGMASGGISDGISSMFAPKKAAAPVWV